MKLKNCVLKCRLSVKASKIPQAVNLEKVISNFLKHFENPTAIQTNAVVLWMTLLMALMVESYGNTHSGGT